MLSRIDISLSGTAAMLAGLLVPILSNICAAQPAQRPTIPVSGRSMQDFVPPGWHLRATAVGDLNEDAAADAAFVIESDAPLVERHDDIADTIRPRVLAILFKSGDGFRLAARHDTFILRADQGGWFDPLDTIAVERGVLRIQFQGGLAWRFNAGYKFRYEKGEFALIGADIVNHHAASGEMSSSSYNFLSMKMKQTTGTISDAEGAGKVRWRAIPSGRKPTLRTLEAPFTLEIFKGEML